MPTTPSSPITPPGGYIREADARLYRPVAYHEAGHALAAVLLGLELHPVSAVRLVAGGGQTWTARLPDTPGNRFREAVVSWAGLAAIPWHPGDGHDEAQVYELVDEATARRAWDAACALVRPRGTQLRTLADALLAAAASPGKVACLTARQVHEVIGTTA